MSSRTSLAPTLFALLLAAVALHSRAGDEREASRRDAYSEFPASQDSGTAVNAWTSTSSLATGTWSPGAAAYGGYLYTAGGYAGPPYETVQTNVAQYAPIQPDGSLGQWTATSSLNKARGFLALATQNGFVYAAGGRDINGNAVQTVEVAAINSSDGSLASWNYTSSMVHRRFSMGVAIWNGHIYAVGGVNGDGGYHASAEYASIGSDGSLGTWTLTSSMTTVRQGPGVVAYNGYLYAIAGWCGWDCPLASVEFAKIKSDGSLDTWQSTTALPAPIPIMYSFSAVARDGYIYTFGDTSGVQRARIKSDGSLGSWNTVGVSGSYPSWRAIAESKGYYYSVGGTYDGGTTAAATAEYVTFRLPVIASFTPTSQRYNQSITITGDNFSDTPGNNLVVFSGDVVAPASTATADSLTVTVPVGAIDGPIRVISKGQASNLSAASLTILAPVATSFSPTLQTIGGGIQIAGANFSANAANNVVVFSGGVQATASVATPTTLTVTVPPGAATGPISVTTNGLAGPKTAGTLSILSTISSFSPTTQIAGEEIEISGTGFSPVAGQNTVLFNGGTPVVLATGRPTALTVRIPVIAASGPIAVITNGVTGAQSVNPLTVLPTVIYSDGFPSAPAGTIAGCYQKRTVNGRTSYWCPVFCYQGVDYWFFTPRYPFYPRANVNIVGYYSGNVFSQKLVTGLTYVFEASINYQTQQLTITGQGSSGEPTSVTLGWNDLSK